MKGTHYESAEDDAGDGAGGVKDDSEDNEDDGGDSEVLEPSTNAQPTHGDNLRRHRRRNTVRPTPRGGCRNALE